MAKKILVIGSSNVDMIMKLDRLPQLGETITDGTFVQTFGGKGANQAVAAARLGGEVTFVTCLGEDAYADRLISLYAQDGIDTSLIFKEKGIPSGTALVMVGDAGKNYLAVAPGSNYRMSKKHIDLCIDKIKEADAIIIQLEIPVDTTKYILDLGVIHQKRIIYNLAPIQPFDEEYIKKCNVFIVNETEAEAITGLQVITDEEVNAAGDTLLKMGPPIVIITLGARGCFYATAGERGFISTFHVQAVDTTAAGDTFCGSLAVALVENKSLREAIIFANAASAISVTRLGAMPSVPYRKEVDAFLLDEMVL